MKLSKEDVVRVSDADPLDLFLQGIRAEETREKYTRTLKQVLCKFLEDILEGDFEARARQFVAYAKEDPDWMLALLLNLSRKLRERTELPADNPEYLNPDSLGNYFKPLKKLLGMNDVPMPWKRVYATFPELDNMPSSKGWTREDIAGMLKNARDPMERALVLVLASSGMRSGGLDLTWEDLTPVYRAGDGGLTLDPGAGGCKVACAALEVYRGSAEAYPAFITPEAFGALQEYGRQWTRTMGRESHPTDPIFLAMQGDPKKASRMSLEKRLRLMAERAGLRDPGDKKGRRHGVPLFNGFRRFWNKTCKESISDDSPLASLIKKEYMMGHRGLVALDKNYYKTNLVELAAEYLHAVPDLTIDDSERLRVSNRRMSTNIRELEEKNARIAQLEEQVAEMKARQDGGLGNLDDLLEHIKKSGKEKEVPGEALESLTGLLRQLEAGHGQTLREIRGEYDEKIADMQRTIDEMARGKFPGRENFSGEHEKREADYRRGLPGGPD